MTQLNYYADVPLDRVDSLRHDADGLMRLRTDLSSRVLVLWQDKHQIVGDERLSPIWHTGNTAQNLLSENQNWVFLGRENNIAHFAVDISHIEDLKKHFHGAHEGQFMDLRSIGPLLDRRQSATMAYARGLLFWNRQSRFCGKCGHPTKHSSGGHIRKCTNDKCKTDHFPRTDPAIIVLVVHDNDCLLGRQKIWPKGMRSTLAGFLEPGETLEQTVARELEEEAGVKLDGSPIYQHSQPWPFPSSLMIGFYARAIDKTLNVNTEEIESADWFSREQLIHSPENEILRLPRQDSIARRLIDDWLSNRTSL